LDDEEGPALLEVFGRIQHNIDLHLDTVGRHATEAPMYAVYATAHLADLNEDNTGPSRSWQKMLEVMDYIMDCASEELGHNSILGLLDDHDISIFHKLYHFCDGSEMTKMCVYLPYWSLYSLGYLFQRDIYL